MIWTEDDIKRLRELWDQGHSSNAIGRMMNISKNSVVGKAHRLDLTARPSPIKRAGEPRSLPSPRPAVAIRTLPPMASEIVAPFVDRVPSPPKPPEPVVMLQAHQPIPLAKPARATPKPPPCCWPIGHPRTKGFRFCDEPSVPGRPYCMPHCRKAYVMVRSRDDETETATESVS